MNRHGKTHAWYNYLVQLVKAGKPVNILCRNADRAKEILRELKKRLEVKHGRD